MSMIGYARVSSDEQNIARQMQSLSEIGADKVFIDKCSGSNMQRPELKKMLEYVREGDIVVVSEFSRLARSTKDMLSIVDQLNSKNVALRSLKEQLDTDSPQGRFMMTVFSALSELERESILQRQREGIAIAKAAGKYKGRKPIPYDESLMRFECKKWRCGQQTAVATMKTLGMKPNRFYRIVKELGL